MLGNAGRPATAATLFLYMYLQHAHLGAELKWDPVAKEGSVL